MRFRFLSSPWRLLVAGLGLLGLSLLTYAYLFRSTGKFGSRWEQLLAEEEDEEEEEEARGDRPDLAWAQDAALTRDPATGRVPRERLVAAARYNEARLTEAAQQRTTTQSLSFASWKERGPSNVGGRILALLVDERDATGNTVWAASAGGGLWKITNATTSSYQWTGISSGFSNLAVSAIAAEPGNPQVMYVGTGEGYSNADAIQGAGIWKSTNGGASWAQLSSTGNASFYYVQKIVVHPVTKDVYAATRNGLWRTQNGGSSWSLVLGPSTSPTASVSSRVADLEIGADNTLYASLGIFNTDGIYRSSTGNAGDWTKLNTLSGSGLPTTGYQRIELACAPSDANRLYAAFQATTGTSLLNIYRSTDKGNTWQVLGRPGGGTADFTNGQGWYNIAVAVSPADANTVYVGGLDLWSTSDAGSATPGTVSWDRQSGWSLATTSPYYVHADHHAIAFVPTTTAPANKAFFGSDGGVAYSADASVSNATQPQFSQRNNGLNVTQFYAVAAHPTNYNYFLAGSQDNGTQKFTAAGLGTTTSATGGDGGFCAIDQDAPQNQITSYVYSYYWRSTNGGSSFTTFNFSGSAGSFINPWDYDSRANVLYAAYNTDTYWAWTNPLTATSVSNATTLNPSLGTGAGKVTHVTVAPLTENRIYVGTNAGKLLRIDNANTGTPTITTLRNGSASTSVSCVAVDGANENHLLLTYANYGTVSVYETTNGGGTWTSVEGTLPDMPVRWALFDPRDATRALLATEMGVYSTDALSGSSTQWQPALYGPMMNTRVDMLRYRPGDKTVVAATHGRGLFTSDVFALTQLPLPVELTAFTARATAPGVDLRWQTASEQNAAGFAVERAGPDLQFARVGYVPATGQSTTPRAYAYLDATARPGQYFYRLRMLDQDGTFRFSAPASVTVDGGTGPLLVSAYPNPFGPELTLELREAPAGPVALSLTDAQGRRVFSTQVTPATRTFRTALPASLAAGTYLLTVQSGRETATRRVLHR